MVPMSDDTRHTLFLCFTVQGILNVVATVITLHIVVFYSPPSANNHRWFQALVLVCGLISDISCAILCPMPTMPTFGVYSVSDVHFSQRMVLAIACTYMFFYFGQVGSLILCLLYKAYAILEGREKQRLRSIFLPWTVVMALGLTLFPAFFIAAYNMGLDERTKYIISTVPEYFSLQTTPSAIIFPFDVIFVKLAFILIFIYVPYCVAAPLTSSYLAYRKLTAEAHQSSKTTKMKKKMLYCIFLQLSTPVVIMAGPYACVALKIVFNIMILPEEVTRIFALFAGTHTLFNCSIIFAFSPTYRSELMRILALRPSSKRRPTVVAIAPQRRTTIDFVRSIAKESSSRIRRNTHPSSADDAPRKPTKHLEFS